MEEVVRKHPFLIELAKRAISDAGLTPAIVPIRGGTDGARLSFMGLPCPNLGTGGYNFHGESEFADVNPPRLLFPRAFTSWNTICG